jgi:hypothetical protein
LNILPAFTIGNRKWNRIGLDLEQLVYKTTRYFYLFVTFSALFYFTIPVVVHFLLFAGRDDLQWPLPVQV